MRAPAGSGSRPGGATAEPDDDPIRRSERAGWAGVGADGSHRPERDADRERHEMADVGERLRRCETDQEHRSDTQGPNVRAPARERPGEDPSDGREAVGDTDVDRRLEARRGVPVWIAIQIASAVTIVAPA